MCCCFLSVHCSCIWSFVVILIFQFLSVDYFEVRIELFGIVIEKRSMLVFLAGSVAHLLILVLRCVSKCLRFSIILSDS